MTRSNIMVGKHIPEPLLDRYSIATTYVAKLGFLRFNLNDNIRQRFLSKELDARAPIREFITELYTLLSKSPHVMDITPSLDELSKKYDERGWGIEVWPPYCQAVTLNRFLKLRIVLPQRKREQLAFSRWMTWNPEEFTVYFNGALFAVYAPVASLPIATDLGQVTREFLRETLSPSEMWRKVDGFGPTPIHPELYFVFAKPIKESSPPSITLPIINTVGDDLIIIVPSDMTLNTIVGPLLLDMNIALSAFYRYQVSGDEFKNTVDELETLNEKLSGQVAQYFRLPMILRIFSTVSGDIRKLLADMHAAIQKVSAAEIRLKRARESALTRLAKTTFLNAITNYFARYMRQDITIDREVQLTTMNFAAQETSNFATIRAILLAALFGALIGGLLTALARYYFKI